MKKLLALCVLTGCMSLLHAAPSSSSSTQSSQQNGSTNGSMRNNGRSQSQSGTSSTQQYGTSSQYNNSQYGTSQYGSSQNGTQSQYGGMNDQTLKSQIQSSLGSSEYRSRYGNVTASVNNGNVTLQGTVNSQDEKDALGALVGGINGVKSVTNDVTVKNGSQSYGGTQNHSGSHQGYSNGSSSHGGVDW